ncbi:MAG: glycosyltransferase [Chloroflexota bacterium]|nr:glycosyltransferase [Dehalococcoidia bacterium]MDW8253470.1 glycosyltransferase [Chloroflexota bacterium]
MRVAIVHDWLNQTGGAENVLDVLHELYPDAPIYTSMYDPVLMHPKYRQWDIRTSFMQRLPGVTRHHQPYLPLYPLAFESFDLSAYDLVISNSSGFCHGVVTRPEAVHINYCLTPPRYCWMLPQYLERERVGRVARRLLPILVSALRLWDAVASQRVDHFIGISRAIAARIRKFYRRDAEVIYPPVETSRFAPQREVGEYYLIVSRLIPYKRVDLAIRAFNLLGKPLWIVGDGRDRPALERIAGPTIRFLGRLPAGEVERLFAQCRALIFPGEEDFGITPVEAQAAGRPVVAFGAGGALETVLDGQTGVFFHEPTAESLAEAVERVERLPFDPDQAVRWARTFDTAIFRERLTRSVARAIERHALAAS